jgi:GT2 family glycosyltransferase
VRRLCEAPGCGLVGGRVELSFADDRHPTAVELFESLWGFPQEFYVLRHRWTVTANLLARREAFDKAGPFDCRLKSDGDREWCGRAAAAGYQIAYAERAVVSHPARRTLEEISRKTRRISGGRVDGLRHRSRNHLVAQAKDLLWEARPPYNAVGRIWAESRIQGLATRLRVLGVVLFVRYLATWERLRLLCGAESRR